MERLPFELIDEILQICVYSSRKNNVLELRLVCKSFDRVLKPYTCRTLGLDNSRLNRTSRQTHPQKDALQTIGDYCKGLYIDMRLLRDNREVIYYSLSFADPYLEGFCQTLQTNYCMSELSFTELEYYGAVQDLLSNCRQVERLRLHLPLYLTSRRHCGPALTIFVNTFEALVKRPKNSAVIKVLVLDNVPDFAFSRLWDNGGDMCDIFSEVEHLSMTLDFGVPLARQPHKFETCFWSLIHQGRLKSMCLGRVDPGLSWLPRSLKQTNSQLVSRTAWNATTLPGPKLSLHCHLRCLELKGVELSASALLDIVRSFKCSLEELYLIDICLKVRSSEDWNHDSTKRLWIGLPNQRPQSDCKWIAIKLRQAMCKLRICRATFLGYDQYLMGGDGSSIRSDFDLIDPCGLGRSVSQRFVEVIMGVRQPNDPHGKVIEYLPSRTKHDERFTHNLVDRADRFKITDHNAGAYQVMIDNTTSHWGESLDGVFPSSNPATQAEWDHIYKTVRDPLSVMD